MKLGKHFVLKRFKTDQMPDKLSPTSTFTSCHERKATLRIMMISTMRLKKTTENHEQKRKWPTKLGYCENTF